MAESLSIVLVGIGGYGEVYLSSLLDEPHELPFRIVGAVDPAPEKSRRLPDLEAQDILLFPSLEDFYNTGKADLAVISSPIHLHAPQVCEALSHGSHVLCEKPAAATVQDVDRMLARQDETGKWVALGYQWSFSTAIQALKHDIRSGLFGAPTRLKSLCLWPRNEAYYARNDWAGKIKDGKGNWILDSPVNNAMAHDLHNMLYLLGDRMDQSAHPVSVEAELYRANEIENCDTAALRIRTDLGAEILFYGSHAVSGEMGPVFSFEFSEGDISFEGGDQPIKAQYKGGKKKEYPSPYNDTQTRKLWICMQAAAGAGEIPFGLEAARAQTLCVNGAHDAVPEIADIPPSLVRISGSQGHRQVWVEGLAETLMKCFEESRLPGELGEPWTRPGKKVDLRDYTGFPGGKAAKNH